MRKGANETQKTRRDTSNRRMSDYLGIIVGKAIPLNAIARPTFDSHTTKSTLDNGLDADQNETFHWQNSTEECFKNPSSSD